MLPLNSNKLKNFHFTTSQNNVTITVHKCSVFFSSFFNLCTVYFTKNVCSFFLFFSLYTVFNNVQVLLFFFLFLCPFFPLSCSFLFLFWFSFFFSIFFFFIINCSFNVPFFSNLIFTSLCPYLNTITIGSLPSLFNFSL